MNYDDFKNNISYETLREECCFKHECEFLECDYDEIEDSDGTMCPYENWWCSAQEGNFCKRLNEKLEFDHD